MIVPDDGSISLYGRQGIFLLPFAYLPAARQISSKRNRLQISYQKPGKWSRDKIIAMNIYFSCAITGGRSDQAAYAALVSALLSDGHEVPTAHLSDPNVMEEEAIVSAQSVYERDVAWIKKCDVVVAEVSTPSHGVGYEIALAEAVGKPVICCYFEGRRVSKMITGNSNPAFKVISYHTVEELIEDVQDFLKAFNNSSQTSIEADLLPGGG